MQKWEYLNVSREWHLSTESWHWSDNHSFGSVADMMNKLGSDGWELVSVLSESSGTGDYAGRTTYITWYFKRPNS